eukprot:gnl/Chilomastix_cuspidata/3485.p1 GENE.gnl/Chilomastix_cuspidata/3485~~gnl/Chilomastix_cuspidata/3485.p1  ORF type:complete len:732 (-),score=356.23 gnl/Chilomastix_cuspidata/3485:390-2585(-)
MNISKWTLFSFTIKEVPDILNSVLFIGIDSSVPLSIHSTYLQAPTPPPTKAKKCCMCNSSFVFKKPLRCELCQCAFCSRCVHTDVWVGPDRKHSVVCNVCLDEVFQNTSADIVSRLVARTLLAGEAPQVMQTALRIIHRSMRKPALRVRAPTFDGLITQVVWVLENAFNAFIAKRDPEHRADVWARKLINPEPEFVRQSGRVLPPPNSVRNLTRSLSDGRQVSFFNPLPLIEECLGILVCVTTPTPNEIASARKHTEENFDASDLDTILASKVLRQFPLESMPPSFQARTRLVAAHKAGLVLLGFLEQLSPFDIPSIAIVVARALWVVRNLTAFDSFAKELCRRRRLPGVTVDPLRYFTQITSLQIAVAADAEAPAPEPAPAPAACGKQAIFLPRGDIAGSALSEARLQVFEFGIATFANFLPVKPSFRPEFFTIFEGFADQFLNPHVALMKESLIFSAVRVASAGPLFFGMFLASGLFARILAVLMAEESRSLLAALAGARHCLKALTAWKLRFDAASAVLELHPSAQAGRTPAALGRGAVVQGEGSDEQPEAPSSPLASADAVDVDAADTDAAEEPCAASTEELDTPVAAFPTKKDFNEASGLPLERRYEFLKRVLASNPRRAAWGEELCELSRAAPSDISTGNIVFDSLVTAHALAAIVRLLGDDSLFIVTEATRLLLALVAFDAPSLKAAIAAVPAASAHVAGIIGGRRWAFLDPCFSLLENFVLSG